MSDDPQVVLDARFYGFLSREWLLAAALKHAPHENLEAAIRAQVIYLTQEKALSKLTQLDMLAQISLTGVYIPTILPQGYDDEEDETVEVTPDGQVHAKENPGTPISEEDIEGFLKWFNTFTEDMDPDDERNT